MSASPSNRSGEYLAFVPRASWGPAHHDPLGLAPQLRRSSFAPALRSPLSVQVCAALASVWLAIQILTSYPLLFMVFFYPIVLAAILEPMKMSLWQFSWALSLTFKGGLRKAMYYAGWIPSGENRHKKIQVQSKSACSETSNAFVEIHGPRRNTWAGATDTDELEHGCQSASRRSTLPSINALVESWPPDAAQVVSRTAMWYVEMVYKKVLLALSILLCLAVAGRMLVIIAKIIIHSAELIVRDFSHYENGAQHRLQELKEWIGRVAEAKFGRRIEFPVDIFIAVGKQMLTYADHAAISASAYVVQQVVPSTCMTTLFLVFLMWNPVKADGTRKEIIDLCFDFVKVKSFLSMLLGMLVGFSLKMCGLELDYAAALLVTVANFIPNGALLCSLFPCIFALFDDRKNLSQVITAFIIEVVLINCFAFVVEPLFFGAAIEMHPIPAILGVTFFGYIWGVPGMLISIPILGAARLALAACASKIGGHEDSSLLCGLQEFIEGKWTTGATLRGEEVRFDIDVVDTEMEIMASELGRAAPNYEGVAPHSERSTNFIEQMSTFIEEFKRPWNTGAAALEDEMTRVSCGYNRFVHLLRLSYEEYKIWIDGFSYCLLVYFFFSSWSDHVFGIFSDPGDVEAALEKESASKTLKS